MYDVVLVEVNMLITYCLLILSQQLLLNLAK